MWRRCEQLGLRMCLLNGDEGPPGKVLDSGSRDLRLCTVALLTWQTTEGESSSHSLEVARREKGSLRRWVWAAGGKRAPTLTQAVILFIKVKSNYWDSK